MVTTLQSPLTPKMHSDQYALKEFMDLFSLDFFLKKKKNASKAEQTKRGYSPLMSAFGIYALRQYGK